MGSLIVAASIIVQLFLIYLLVDFHGMGRGEGRGFAGMGLLKMIVFSLYVVVPGTIIALVRATKAFANVRGGGDQTLSLFFNSGVTLLPLLVFAVLNWADNPPPESTARPNTPQEELVAGYAWAMDNGVEREADCNTGSPDFIAGCQRYVKLQQGRAAH